KADGPSPGHAESFRRQLRLASSLLAHLARDVCQSWPSALSPSSQKRSSLDDRDARREPVPFGYPPLQLLDAVKQAAEGKRFFLSEHLLNVGSRYLHPLGIGRLTGPRIGSLH